jgi:hypothetical protein
MKQRDGLEQATHRVFRARHKRPADGKAKYRVLRDAGVPVQDAQQLKQYSWEIVRQIAEDAAKEQLRALSCVVESNENCLLTPWQMGVE